MADENDTIVTPPVEPTTPPVEPTTPPVEPTTPPVDPGVTNPLVGLSKELLANGRLKGVTSLEDLANRLVEAKLAPEIPAPDGYALPEGVPPEMGQFAHEQGLTQEQFDGVVAKMQTWGSARDVMAFDELAEQGKAKVAEWGEAGEANISLAVSGVGYLEKSNPGLRKMLNETGYGNHPLILEVFKSVGEMVREGGFVKGDTFTPAAKKSTAQRMFPSQEKIT